MKKSNRIFYGALLITLLFVHPYAGAQFISVLYDSTGSFIVSDVKTLDQNEALMVGAHSPLLFQYHDGCMMKMDAYGNLLWERNYHSNALSYQLSCVVEDTAQHHLLAIGNSNDTALQMLCILVTDSSGHLISAKNYTDSVQTEYLVSRYGAISTADGNAAISGYAWDGMNGGLFLMKCDMSGNVLWAHTFVDTTHINSNDCTTLKETPDQGFAIASVFNRIGIAGYMTEINRFDANGNFLWHRIFSTPGFQVGPQHLMVTSSGEIYICGYSQDHSTGNDYRGVLIKLNAQGDVIFAKQYFAAAGCALFGISATPDGNLFINAATEMIPGGITTMIKTDTSGNVLWYSKIEDPEGDDFFGSLEPMDDGGYGLGATRSYIDSSFRYAIAYLKTDSLATMPCFQSVTTLTDSVLPLAVDTFPAAYRAVNIFSTIETLIESTGVNWMAYCSAGGLPGEQSILPANLTVYPDPFNDVISLQVNEKLFSRCVINIFDSMGSLILTKLTDQSTLELDVSGFSRGIYIITVQGGQEYFSKKMVKL